MALDDQRALRWDLQARVAEQYWTVARLQAARARLDDDERAAAETLAAQRLKLQLGTIKPGDVDAAAADARALALQRQANTLALETARRTIAALVDASPHDFPLPHATLPREAARTPAAGAPMQVLDARPDVHHARLVLDQALLGERIARVNRYPTLSLSPAIATGGATWRHLLDDPGLSLGLGLGLTFVDWRARGIAQTQALTRKEMAAVQFRDALWLALADVAQRQEDFALSLATLADAQGQVAEAARALENARVRLAAGVAPPQELRDAQRVERAARNREDDAWRAHWVAWLAVRRALGGDVDLRPPA
jgi:outer membrane protein TolC